MTSRRADAIIATLNPPSFFKLMPGVITPYSGEETKEMAVLCN
jgi:hypothetical protein